MADAKLTALTATTSIDGTELLYVVEDPSGTPVERKVTVANVLLGLAQPLDADLTAIAALTTTAFGRAVLALADAAALRTAAGLGTAAVVDTGTSAANVPTITQADARYQGLDSDLTTIAGLTATTDNVMQAKAGAWASRTLAQLMTDLAALGTTFQPLDSDLTAIAALTTTSFGRSLLAAADATALRVLAGTVIGTDVQAFDADLTTLATAFITATATVAASLSLAEGTNNGTNTAKIIAPASMSGDRVLTLPDATDTLVGKATTDTLTNKSISGATNTLTVIPVTALNSGTSASSSTFWRGDGTWATPSGAADKLGLTPTAVKTANYSAAVGDLVPCNTSGGAFTVTLPTAPADGSVIAVKIVTGGAPLTVALGGSDVFNKAAGATSGTLNTLNQAILVQYQSSSAIWYVVADDLPPRNSFGGNDTGFRYITPGLTRLAFVEPVITLTSGVTYYFGPYDNPAALSVDAVETKITSLTGTSKVSIAFINMNPATWQPTTLQYVVAEQTFTTSGEKIITFTAQTIPAGTYLIGVRTDNSTTALSGMRCNSVLGFRGDQEGYGTFSHMTVSEAYAVFSGTPTAATAWQESDTASSTTACLIIPVLWRIA